LGAEHPSWFWIDARFIEVCSAIALLVPSTAIFGALLLIPTMLGAIVANVFVAHTSPVVPLLLLLAAAAVARARRHQLRVFLTNTSALFGRTVK
jgi:hypothetical protein